MSLPQTLIDAVVAHWGGKDATTSVVSKGIKITTTYGDTATLRTDPQKGKGNWLLVAYDGSFCEIRIEDGEYVWRGYRDIHFNEHNEEVRIGRAGDFVLFEGESLPVTHTFRNGDVLVTPTNSDRSVRLVRSTDGWVPQDADWRTAR